MHCRFATIVQKVCDQARRQQAEIEDSLDTWQSIANLPKDLRQLAYLFAEGSTDVEAGECLGLSADQVYRRRQRLKKLYK